MVSHVNPVLLYHPDGYVTSRKDLKGRHSAGESFLTAFLDQAPGPDIHALCIGQGGADEFKKAVQSSERKLNPRVVQRGDIENLRNQGVLYLPFPGIAEEAQLRSFSDDAAYALCGVTHTISSREVLDGIASLVTAPVQEWDALICTSKAVHDALSKVIDLSEDRLTQRIGATRFKRPMMPIIPLGIHSERFTPKESNRRLWREKLGLADDVVAILYFGRLSIHAKASPFQLAQAVQRATTKTDKPFAIIWCGWFNDDFQRRSFMETAQSMATSVPFHYVDGREADTRFSIWAAADIFCSLSDNIQESFGLTVIEAMASGLPTVVSNWNGYREAVEHGKNGVLIDSYMPKNSLLESAYRYRSNVDTYDLYIGALSQLCFVDLEQAAEWFVKLSNKPELRHAIAIEGRKTVENRFDWKVVMPQYFDLWEEQTKRVEHARADRTNPQKRSAEIFDPAIIFAGFPSHFLSYDTAVTQGPHFARWSDLVRESGIVVNASVLTGRRQFEILKKALGSSKPKKIGDLLLLFASAEQDPISRTLHWAIKIGLLEISKSGPDTT